MKKKSINERSIWLIGISICLILAIPYFAMFNDGISKSNADWGTFGDYIGGIVGSAGMVLSVYFLYRTFATQIQSATLEKFENKYYELIKLHKENVAEIAIGKDSGKKVFVLLFREFRLTLEEVKIVCQRHYATIKKEELINIAYLAFFFGTGPNSTRILKNTLTEYSIEFINDLCDRLDFQKQSAKQKRNLNYVPFEGHQSRLAHYFRHLYQTISFVDTNQTLSLEEKKSYIKTIRAQLTNHEQALLFINSISSLGRPWKREGLITTYSLIKNLPKSFINEETEIDVKTVYPGIIFEWEEALQMN